MLLLEQCNPEPLDLYGEYIRVLHETYGSECWCLIYQADVRMRSEEFERIRVGSRPAPLFGPRPMPTLRRSTHPALGTPCS
eukprot:7664441-Alexandrium_andersonii.AAC.1